MTWVGGRIADIFRVIEWPAVEEPAVAGRRMALDLVIDAPVELLPVDQLHDLGEGCKQSTIYWRKLASPKIATVFNILLSLNLKLNF